jgi:hypothetical protein
MVEKNLSLLLVYKDNLTIGGERGFPLTTDSQTILDHFKKSNVKAPKIKKIIDMSYQLDLFNPIVEKSKIKSIEVNNPPENCFVWGWWKKSGEQHHNLLNYLSDCCLEGQKVKVFLQNSYLRRVYLAELLDLYFVPYSNTVEIPIAWTHRCPDYYALKPHLCGCYFVLRLLEFSTDTDSPKINYRTPSEIFKNFFIDELSFDVDYH